MVELADTQDLGSCADGMQVRPLLPAPIKKDSGHICLESLFYYLIFMIKTFKNKFRLSLLIYILPNKEI